MDNPIDVLWVEAEEELARTASAYLGMHGVQVRVVTDVAQGVAAVLRSVPDAVILDGRVPHAMLIEIFTRQGAGTLVRLG